MVEQSGTQALNSLTHVFVSLTPNAKKIYIIIIKYQLANEDDNYNGISFMELYRKCRSEFLVPSDLALRTPTWPTFRRPPRHGVAARPSRRPRSGSNESISCRQLGGSTAAANTL